MFSAWPVSEVAITHFFTSFGETVPRFGGAGRIHAAVFDACLFVVRGHSGRNIDLRLHAQSGRGLLQWLGLWVEEHERGLDLFVATDHGYFACLWPDAAGF